MSRYFKLIPVNESDRVICEALLKSKTFYPESSSTPALPASPDPSFDYRQFFRYIGIDPISGYFVVRTREDIDEAGFGTDMVPTADWTTRYNMSSDPDVVAYDEYPDVVNVHKTRTDIDAFFVYSYPNDNGGSNP